MTISRFTRPLGCFVASLLLLGLSSAVQAAVGGLSVRVVDATTNRPLAGVAVTARSRDGAEERATTGADGLASFAGLSDGFHEVRTALDGYAPGVEPAVRVIERRTGLVRFELLPVAAALEEVVIVSRALRADPNGSAADRYITRDELRNAAGSGSDVMRALVGLPGVVKTASSPASRCADMARRTT